MKRKRKNLLSYKWLGLPLLS